jgi:hypothetical protein
MAGEPNQLRIVALRLLEDQIPTEESGGALPARYGVLLGLSRRMTVFERAELVQEGFLDTGDLMWLGIQDTTLEEVRDAIPRFHETFATAESNAHVFEQAVGAATEGLAAQVREEAQHRQTLLGEINAELRNDN